MDDISLIKHRDMYLEVAQNGKDKKYNEGWGYVGMFLCYLHGNLLVRNVAKLGNGKCVRGYIIYEQQNMVQVII